jgi:hypothetical protein
MSQASDQDRKTPPRRLGITVLPDWQPLSNVRLPQSIRQTSLQPAKPRFFVISRTIPGHIPGRKIISVVTPKRRKTMIKQCIITIGLLSFMASPSLASPKASCAAIDKAISANEDFVEVALRIDDLPVPPALASIKTTYAAVKADLSKTSQADAEAKVAEVEQYIAANNLPLAAVAAIETYKVLITGFTTRLPTPYDVALLDYTGFKILSHTAAPSPDWPALTATVAESTTAWEKTKANLKDQAIIDLVDSTHDRMAAALVAKDPNWLGAMAQILLDSVDLIERQAKNPAKTACK